MLSNVTDTSIMESITMPYIVESTSEEDKGGCGPPTKIDGSLVYK